MCVFQYSLLVWKSLSFFRSNWNGVSPYKRKTWSKNVTTDWTLETNLNSVLFMNALVFYSCSKRLKICLPGSDLMFFFQFNFHGGGSYDIETSPLICSANYWTGFYMIGTSFVKEHVKYIVYKTQQPQWLNTRKIKFLYLYFPIRPL